MRLIDRVELLLQQEPELRDSDKKLILRILDQDGLHLTDEQKRAYMGSTTFESITRARRALKAQYPASRRIDNERFEKYKQYRYETALML